MYSHSQCVYFLVSDVDHRVTKVLLSQLLVCDDIVVDLGCWNDLWLFVSASVPVNVVPFLQSDDIKSLIIFLRLILLEWLLSIVLSPHLCTFLKLLKSKLLSRLRHLLLCGVRLASLLRSHLRALVELLKYGVVLYIFRFHIFVGYGLGWHCRVPLNVLALILVVAHVLLP